MHKNFISKYGLFLSTFVVTILSIIFSIFITYSIMFLTGDEFVFLSLMISVIAPAIIAPSFVVVYGKFNCIT